MFKDQIEAGAALLDKKLPEWEEMQDVDRLDLLDSCDCVLGQIEEDGEYWDALKKLFPNAQTDQELYDLSIKHGFSIKAADSGRLTDEDYQIYERLTQEWKAYITDRRKQNATI